MAEPIKVTDLRGRVRRRRGSGTADDDGPEDDR